MAEPAVVHAPDLLWRVARSDDPLTMSEISPADYALADAGNRFDTLGGGVLYCGTEAVGCYAETLARFRPSAAIRMRLAEEPSDGFMVCAVFRASGERAESKFR